MAHLKQQILALFCSTLAFVALLSCAYESAYAQETETLPVVFIVVGFDGDAQTQPVPYDAELDWSGTIFGANDTLSSFYRDMSGGSFTFAPASETSEYAKEGNYNVADRAGDGVIHITLPQPHGRWATVNESRSVAREFAHMAMNALDVAARSIDFKAYDKNGDGKLAPNELAVCFCIAGYEASALESYQTSDLPLMWSHAGLFSILSASERTWDGLEFDSYIAVAEYYWPADDPQAEVEQEPLGVLYHELGHYLGLPDLYSVESPEAPPSTWSNYQVRTLSLMDTGGWAYVQEASDWHYEPAALDAWSRYVLGWTQPQTVTQSGDYEVRSQQCEGGYTSLLIPTNDPDEFFLVENRQPTGYDASIPTGYPNANGGVVVWHIDKRTYRTFNSDNTVNNADHHPAIMELFFDASGQTAWPSDTPNIDRPFFDAAACQTESGALSVELPIYPPPGSPDAPQSCAPSGIRLSFPTGSGPSMVVHVDMPACTQESAGTYPLGDGVSQQLQQAGSELGSLACAALLQETEADIALINAGSFQRGIDSGLQSWEGIYGILSGSTHVVCYTLSGEQLVDVIEHSLAMAASCRESAQGSGNDAQSLLAFGGIVATVDWSQADGSRLVSPSVKGQAIQPHETYTVATIDAVATLPAYPVFSQTSPNTSMLWGNANDAIRSFIQTQGWEKTAVQAFNQMSYEEPREQVAPADTAFGFLASVPLAPIALGCGALLFVVIGAIATARARR